MIIVVDVNVLLSALIKDSTTRELIIKSGQEFCFPEPALQKIRIYTKKKMKFLNFIYFWYIPTIIS